MAIDPYNTSPREEPWDTLANEPERPVEVVFPRENPSTSVQAFHSSDRRAQHEKVEEYMRARGERGAIADEVDAHFQNDPPMMWRRFAEMRKTGVLKLHPQGIERDTRLGHAARVHVWVPPEKRIIPVVKRVSYQALVTAARNTVAARDAKDPIGIRNGIEELRAVLG